MVTEPVGAHIPRCGMCHTGQRKFICHSLVLNDSQAAAQKKIIKQLPSTQIRCILPVAIFLSSSISKTLSLSKGSIQHDSGLLRAIPAYSGFSDCQPGPNQ